MTPIEIIGTCGAFVGSLAGGYTLASRGGKKGAASALNGTAEAVRRIEKSLAEHRTETSERFDALTDQVVDCRERIAALEGPRPRRMAR